MGASESSLGIARLDLSEILADAQRESGVALCKIKVRTAQLPLLSCASGENTTQDTSWRLFSAAACTANQPPQLELAFAF